MSAQLALDVLLGGGLLSLALVALGARDVYLGVTAFIVFGLLMAMVWARLGAPDLALAEAAIGAGLTGALLLAALGRLRALAGRASLGGEPATGPATRALVGLATAALTAVLAAALAGLPAVSTGLREAVMARLGDSGVGHPVTAVLLNFRGYDTLLELGVLLLAVLAVRAFASPAAAPRTAAPGDPVDGLARLLVPLLVVVAGYLLWRGAEAPGGAFQAGAMLGAAGVLLALSSYGADTLLRGTRGRVLLAAGFGLFLAVAAAVTAGGSAFLAYPRDAAKALILAIEAAASVSIGAALLALFVTTRGGDAGPGA